MELNPSLEIRNSTKEGVVEFFIPIEKLGLSKEQLKKLAAAPYHYLANAMGQVLVRSQIDKFSNLMRNKDYGKLCRAYVHKRFAFHKAGEKACFRFHLNLLYRLINDNLAREIETPAQEKLKKKKKTNLDALVYEAAARPLEAGQGTVETFPNQKISTLDTRLGFPIHTCPRKI